MLSVLCYLVLVQKELQNLKDASDDLMLVDDDIIPYPFRGRSSTHKGVLFSQEHTQF